MPPLQVRELPDFIYRKLSQLARQEYRSIAQQAVILLAKSLDVDLSPELKRKQILNEIRAQSEELKKFSLKAPDIIIREEREPYNW